VTTANVYRRLDGNLFEGWCDVCGDVRITEEAAERVRNLRQAHLLSAALKRRPGNQEYATLDVGEVERILRDTPSEHMDEVVVNLRRWTCYLFSLLRTHSPNVSIATSLTTPGLKSRNDLKSCGKGSTCHSRPDQ
jgi:hypothetical protein